MRVRTFALWAALGVACSAAGATLLPVPSARADHPGTWRVDPAPDPDTSVTSHFVDGKTLLLDGRVGHATIARAARGGNAGTFVLATVTGADLAPDQQLAPPPVHLAIVVDRSGSMAGLKMNNAIAAATGAVERMHDGDRATVVSFDTTARVLVPPTVLDAASRPPWRPPSAPCASAATPASRARSRRPPRSSTRRPDRATR
jgi:Ca-activated chloride channel family protein